MQSLLDNHDLILSEAAIVEPIRRANAVPLDPILVNANLIYDSDGRDVLRKIYEQYMMIALDAKLPFLMCTPTWRANKERVELAGADLRINMHATQFMQDIRAESKAENVRIGGMVGCKNDCYLPSESIPTDTAASFHSWQINELADAGVDFLLAVTLPSVDEAIGIARAMADSGKPYFVSFVIDRSGVVLDGTKLVDAIEKIDQRTFQPPLGYLINCAYPSFLCSEKQPDSLFSRLIGFQGNASSLDHSQLDCADELKMDDLVDWGDEMVSLHRNYGMKILGGCCGTNKHHLQYIVDEIVG